MAKKIARTGRRASVWLCSLALVLVVGQASASPITYELSLTETAGGATLGPDPVSSLDFAGNAGTFSKLVDALSPTIFDDIALGKLIFEMDFGAFDQGCLRRWNLERTHSGT